MESIIQQIAEKLIHKILERAYSGGISDIDALSSDVLGDCREAAMGSWRQSPPGSISRYGMTKSEERRKVSSSKKGNGSAAC